VAETKKAGAYTKKKQMTGGGRNERGSPDIGARKELEGWEICRKASKLDYPGGGGGKF